MWQMSQQGAMRVVKMRVWWSRLVWWPQEGETSLNLEYILEGDLTRPANAENSKFVLQVL